MAPMRRGEIEGLVVRPTRIARVRDPDRGDVHRRTAVDDVPDAGIARVCVAVPELQYEPLLGEEEPVVEQVLAVELGNPHLLVDDRRDDQSFDVVRVEVVLDRVLRVRLRLGRVVLDRVLLVDLLRDPEQARDRDELAD